jgi:hypothetical protein
MPRSPKSRRQAQTYQRVLPTRPKTARPKTCLPDVIGCLDVPPDGGLCSAAFCLDMPPIMYAHIITALIERLRRLTPPRSKSRWADVARWEWHNIALSWNLEARYQRNNDELDWCPPTGEYERWVAHVARQLQHNTRRVGRPHGTARLSGAGQTPRWVAFNRAIAERPRDVGVAAGAMPADTGGRTMRRRVERSGMEAWMDVVSPALPRRGRPRK